MGADAPRVELRQPHGGIPRGGRRPEPAHRVPHRRRGRQSVSRARRVARLGARWHRQQDRAAGVFRRRRLRGTQPAARALYAGAGERALRREQLREARVRRGGGRALRPFLRNRGGGLRQGGHGLGTQALLRENMRLKGKVALITGAGSGIGRQSALLFAREGAAILVVDVNDAAGNGTVAMVKHAAGRAAYHHADISKASEAQEMVAAAEREFGKLNILFNNAGIMHAKDDDAISTDEAVWDLTMDINAKGVFLGCQSGIPPLKRAGGGSVINNASFVARQVP